MVQGYSSESDRPWSIEPYIYSDSVGGFCWTKFGRPEQG